MDSSGWTDYDWDWTGDYGTYYGESAGTLTDQSWEPAATTTVPYQLALPSITELNHINWEVLGHVGALTQMLHKV